MLVDDEELLTSTSPTSRMASHPVVATYSICACDLAAGQWGVATQSKFLAVGSVVPWAAPHAGAIATQSYANPRYGPDGLALLATGCSADEVVERLTAADDGREQRQLGIVDAGGRAATFTGSRMPRLGRRPHRRRLCGTGQHPRLGRNGRRPGGHLRLHRGQAARRAAARLPRGRPGGGRRQAWPAIRCVARGRARRRVRVAVGHARRPADRRPSAPGRGATAPVRPSRSALRQDTARRMARGRREPPRRDRRTARQHSAMRRSRTGPGSRTWRNGSTAATGSTRSCSQRSERPDDGAVPGDAARRGGRLRRRRTASLAHDPRRARDRVVRRQCVARDGGRASDRRRARRARTGRRRPRGAVLRALRARDVHGGRRAGPRTGGVARLRQGSSGATQRRRRRGRDDGARGRWTSRRRLLHLPLGALCRGAALLDDG